MSNVDFIDIDPEADIQALTQKYEDETQTKLYPGQDAKILLNIFAYYINLLKCQFNDAANLNLIENSRFPVLDFLGKRVKCERLESEGDKSYIERILLAPEGYSAAGNEESYKYHILSAHSSIIDTEICVPEEDIKVISKNGYVALNSRELEAEDFDVAVDENYEEVTLKLNRDFAQDEEITVKIPHPYKLYAYILCNENAPEDILDIVQKHLKTLRPISDKLIVELAADNEFTVKGVVYISKDAMLNDVQNSVNEALNTYFNSLKNSLNKKVDLYDIAHAVRSVSGVEDFKIDKPSEILLAYKKIRYIGSAELTYERAY